MYVCMYDRWRNRREDLDVDMASYKMTVRLTREELRKVCMYVCMYVSTYLPTYLCTWWWMMDDGG